jgi:hypothetical protein
MRQAKLEKILVLIIRKSRGKAGTDHGFRCGRWSLNPEKAVRKSTSILALRPVDECLRRRIVANTVLFISRLPIHSGKDCESDPFFPLPVY